MRTGVFLGIHEHFLAITKLKSRNRADNLEPIYILKSHKSFQNMAQSYHEKNVQPVFGGGWLL